jgi:thiamine biosynthesis lipoprotein
MSAGVVGVAGIGSFRRVEHLMGMPVSIALRGRHATTEEGADAWHEVVEELREVDRVFSTYRPDSAVSRLDRGEVTLDDCPAEVAEVLVLGGEAEQQSDGAFSVVLPDGSGRARLDPSGVVKGWAVERAARLLAALDDTDFCLSAGGDLVCHVADPTRPAWRVGVEHPHDSRSLVAVVPVRRGAVATSGTRHRGRHLLDARTGRAAEGVASVTVIDPSLTWADIDATAAYAHGAEAAAWLRGRGRTALVVWPDATTTVLDGRSLPQDSRTPPSPTHHHTPTKGSLS